MNLGANRRNIYILGGLVVVGGYLFYDNVLSGPSGSPAPAAPARATAKKGSAPLVPAFDSDPVPKHVTSSRTSEEFRPSLKPKRPEERVDPMTIDPTLRLDLLAKVQAVNMEGGARNLFAAGAPPLPPEPKVTIAKGPAQAFVGPQPPPPPPAPPAPPPGAAHQPEVLRLFERARR